MIAYNLVAHLYPATMDYDNEKVPSFAVSKTDEITSVVRRRSRGASTRHRHRHTSPAPYEEHSGDDLPPHRRGKSENLAGLGTTGHAFRGFTAAPDIDVSFDEPFVVPSKSFSNKVHNSIPVYASPVITPGHKATLVTPERLGLLPCQPPNVMRTISDESTSSTLTGHNGIVMSIGTTNKFTQKWPRPKSLGYESQLEKVKDARFTGLHPNQSPASTLEDGQGLGSSHVARWTAFKWCLLLSATTVFAYGATALICALMTWFKSQSTSRSQSPC